MGEGQRWFFEPSFNRAVKVCASDDRITSDAGGRVVKHARRLVLQVAQVVAPFWEQLIAGLNRWKLPTRFPPPHGAHHHAWRPPPPHAFRHEVRRC